MKIVGIAGIPGSGKTFVGKKLGEKTNRLALEFEDLRWKFFSADLQENLFKYTKIAKRDDESLRDYYLRCSIIDKTLSLDKFVDWQKETMKFIDTEMQRVITYVKSLPNDYSIDAIEKELGSLLNYKPTEFQNDLIICGHALLGITDVGRNVDEMIQVDADPNERIDKFYKREKWTQETAPLKNVKDYFKGYKLAEGRSLETARHLMNPYNDKINPEIDNIVDSL